MHPSVRVLAVSSLLLHTFVTARPGLSPETIPSLTKITNYTFHQICDRWHNPDPYFDEAEASMLMRGYTNDLSMYLRGYFSFKSTDPSEESKMVADVDIVDTPPALERSPPFQERLRSLRRLRANDKSEFNCTIFESDLHTFSEVFQNMTYALSEKCYRQCAPNGYLFFAASNLQTEYEQPYYARSFYSQIREIEAEEKCFFDDTFLIEADRAADYSKTWISTFQTLKSPCADIGK